MRIAILGYARQGISSYEYWKNPDNQITICDKNTELAIPNDCTAKLGPDYLSNLDKFDLIVRTPKLHPKDIVKANPSSTNILAKVSSNTNEFLRICPTKNIIGVTGTKGKGTTCSLITEMLRANGHRVHLGGNIGTPPLDLLKEDIQPDDWVVLELANFQLIDCMYSPPIGVVLMISDEHLDWHQDMQEYIAAKANLVAYQKPDDTVIYFANNTISKEIADGSVAVKIPYLQNPGAYIQDGSIVIDSKAVCKVSEIGLLGNHNLENICAAITAVWQVHQNITAIAEVVRDFKGLPFRIEHRQNIRGIDYYNDSFSSNPSATIAAIAAINQPKILIIGGKDRGISLEPLLDSIQQSSSIKMLCLVGEASERIANECHARGMDNLVIIHDNSMAAIVAKAQELASAGDAVVLSPGFPSFDMFVDFEDRGRQFNDIVSASNPYKQFIFDHYDLDIETKVLRLHYAIDDELHFVETYHFGIDVAVQDNPAALRRACELLFLAAGVSYYKTYLPPEIIISNSILVDKNLSDFLQKTYQKGLGEFFYINNFDPNTQISFPTNTAIMHTEIFTNNKGLLVGIGGGKDSLLSIELLKNTAITSWSCNHAEKLAPLVNRIDTNHIYVDRVWDPQLKDLNANGAYNGHVPISAILACVGIVLAALTGKQDIVVSNEASASTPTLTYNNVAINHQYSKSLEFEKDFQSVLSHLFDGTKRYYSLLRPYTELAIAKKFAPYFDTYKDVFCSCNKAFTLLNKKMSWCGNCAKCAFTYLMFLPFVEQEKLDTMFGKNLLTDPSLHDIYEQLLGISGNRPFDCVGEIGECRVAYNLAKEKGATMIPLNFEPLQDYDYESAREDILPIEIKQYL